MTTSAPRPSVSALICSSAFGVGDDAIRTALSGELGPLRIQLHGNNRRGAQQTRHLNMHVAHRARANHHHGLCHAEADFFTGAHHAREGFGQAGNAIRNLIADRDHQTGWNRHILRKRAVGVNAELADLRAVQQFVAPTIITVAAADIDIGDHPLARRQSRDLATNGNNFPAELVAGN
jgi:hypothetical protein